MDADQDTVLIALSVKLADHIIRAHQHILRRVGPGRPLGALRQAVTR